MRTVRVLSNHDCAWLAHQCAFSEKIARISKSQFQVIKIILQVQMFIDIGEFKYKELFSII